MDGILIGAIIAPSLTVILGIGATYFISSSISRKSTEKIVLENRRATLATVYAVSESIRQNKEISVEDLSKGYEIAERTFH